MSPIRKLYFGVTTILYAVTTILFCDGQTVYVPPLWVDRTEIRYNITGNPNVTSTWVDSYSVGSHCYCSTTFDHQIGGVKVMTPIGRLSIRKVCGLLGPGPGKSGRPVYNDIQCGNGPSANITDEVICPGRADHGKKGCKHIGPQWNFNTTAFMVQVPTKVPTLSPTKVPTLSPTKGPTLSPTKDLDFTNFESNLVREKTLTEDKKKRRNVDPTHRFITLH